MYRGVFGFMLTAVMQGGWNIMSGMNISEAKAIAGTNKYRYIPLWTEELSDMRTPIEVLRILRNVSSHCYLLESAESGKKWGRRKNENNRKRQCEKI